MDNNQKQSSRTSRSQYSQQIRTKMDHFMHFLCSLAIVQQFMLMYKQVKRNNANVDHALNRIENGIRLAYNRSLNLYDQYCQTCFHDNMNGQLKPMLDKLLIFSFGVVFIITQLTLAVFIATINILVTAVSSGKGTLRHASLSATKTAQQITSGISRKVHDVSHSSTKKAEHQANRLLDRANQLAGSTLGVIPETDCDEKTLPERLRDLGYRISENLKSRAHGDILPSTYIDLHSIMERFNNSLSLLNMVRANKSWVTEKFGELHTSLIDLKSSLEREAERIKEDPEKALLNYLRQNSTLLSAQLNILKESSGQLLNESATKKLDAVILYLGELDRNLGEVHNVQELKDEVSDLKLQNSVPKGVNDRAVTELYIFSKAPSKVLKKAHDRLVDLVQWTTNRLAEQQKSCGGTNQVIKKDA